MADNTQGSGGGRFMGAYCVALALAFGFAALNAEAAGNAAATVQLNVPSNVGDVAEVAISLDYADSAPTVMFIFLAFDNMRLAPAKDYYETIPVDANGNPVRDGNGNVQPVQSAVLATPEVAAAGKVVDAAYYATLEDNVARGGIGIALAGLNADPLPKGTVLKAAFRVLNDNRSNDVVAVYGVDSARPIILGGRVVVSSASTSMGAPLSLTVADGSIALGCARPAAPSGVTASQNKNDRVDVAWEGAAGLEYRVFRSAGSDPLAAQALGDAWTTETNFEDVTAETPAVLTNPGCFRPGVYDTVQYYYWVKSRDLSSGCESDASSPAVQGWRVAEKAAAVAAAAWPVWDPGSWIVSAVAVMIMAMRARRMRRSE
jgi:hypothetical protein